MEGKWGRSCVIFSCWLKPCQGYISHRYKWYHSNMTSDLSALKLLWHMTQSVCHPVSQSFVCNTEISKVHLKIFCNFFVTKWLSSVCLLQCLGMTYTWIVLKHSPKDFCHQHNQDTVLDGLGLSQFCSVVMFWHCFYSGSKRKHFGLHFSVFD